MKGALALLVLLATCSLLQAKRLHPESQIEDPLKNAKRIVFLGDSITHSEHYIVYLETALRKTHPDTEFINLGLPSEGCTGLSEPEHPFPRPNVHERLDRVLSKADPDVVFACYGMNDGIYHPFSEERFAQYKDGINLLIEKVNKHGAKLILLTPPPFDPLPLKKKGKLLPADASEFSWKEIYEHYDRNVIVPYGDWILQQKGRVHRVIDLHTPITEFVTEKRKDSPDFVLSNDGVHIDQKGHRLLAEAIYQAVYKKTLPKLDESEVARIEKQHEIMHAAWLTHVGHKRPRVKDGLPLENAREKAAALN